MAYNIFERWPFTSFQNLNLDWLMKATKEAVTDAAAANTKADEAITTAQSYDARINNAISTANVAKDTADEAIARANAIDDMVFIYMNENNKAVDYALYVAGSSETYGANEIFTDLTLHQKLPVFMDRSQYVYVLSGYESSGITVTRFRFSRYAGNGVEAIAWIDQQANVTFATVSSGDGLNKVTFEYFVDDPQHGTGWESDKTFAEIKALLDEGKALALIVKYNGAVRDMITNAHLTATQNGNYISFGYSKGVPEVSPMDSYTNAIAFYTINTSEVVTQQAVQVVPPAAASMSGRVLTVDGVGKAAWLEPSGGGGTVQNGIFLITAVYANGQYTFDRNPSDILSAIVDGKLPVVRYHSSSGNNNEYDMWKMGYCYTDDEDLYIYFDRLNGNGNASQMRWIASTGKAVEVIRPTLPQATSADEGQVPMVNSFGNYQLVTPSASSGTPRITMANTDTAPSLDANKFYVFPEITSLSVSLNAPASNAIVNEYHFCFDSGATATVLTLPASVLQPDGFTVEANMHYEISILEGAMTAQGWAVSSS